MCLSEEQASFFFLHLSVHLRSFFLKLFYFNLFLTVTYEYIMHSHHIYQATLPLWPPAPIELDLPPPTSTLPTNMSFVVFLSLLCDKLILTRRTFLNVGVELSWRTWVATPIPQEIAFWEGTRPNRSTFSKFYMH